VCSAFNCIFEHRLEITDVKLMKNIGHVLCQIFDSDFSDWFD